MRKRGLFTKPYAAKMGAISQAITRTPQPRSPRPTEIETDIGATSSRKFVPKKQYRIIYSDICDTVGNLETLGEVVDVLQGTFVALQLMYCAGWVHRDNSSGNILAHRQGSGKWRVKLLDLEYARKNPPSDNYTSAVELKAGTPYFMPHEILHSKSLFSATREETLSYQDASQKESSLRASFRSKSTSHAITTLLVIHNFQHDLESIWWILI
ncbi:hypothetical protein BDN70DRAFT_371108 [Pholiota conissans]|uniref:Protein kinase domain-containing protein n=1 Tax=Pholiota conissans TaxID=109636 RepID=A0A9P5ZEP8_9AGAR|nr:hypothetical protein BDN70DRAFT_371108 [Pholiota conissans]